jgi:hypothetical protein
MEIPLSAGMIPPPAPLWLVLSDDEGGGRFCSCAEAATALAADDVADVVEAEEELADVDAATESRSSFDTSHTLMITQFIRSD